MNFLSLAPDFQVFEGLYQDKGTKSGIKDHQFVAKKVLYELSKII